MKVAIITLSVAAIAIGGAPAFAQHYTNHGACDQWRHGSCVSWHHMARREARAAGYDVGYNFGPSQSYVDVAALPPPIVSQYHLGPSFRYVNENGFVYVVNPHTYRVARVIRVP